MLIHLASAPVSTSLAGDVVLSVVAPLMVATIIGSVTWARAHGRRVNDLSQAMALVLNELSPVDRPSLRDLLGKNADKLAQLATQQALAAQRQTFYEKTADDRWKQIHPA